MRNTPNSAKTGKSYSLTPLTITVRQWLNGQTFEQGTAFGEQAVENVQNGVRP
jgi:hypothetical protein